VLAPTATSQRPECRQFCCAKVRGSDSHPRLPVHRGIAGLDDPEIFNAYNEVQATRDTKRRVPDSFIDAIMTISTPGTPRERPTRRCSKSLIVFACLMEGLFFTTQILAGPVVTNDRCSQQYRYILRDESMHCNFGID
jgi:ribonucleotide reductase beta subunit family protein with ferritin-like domain